MATHLIGLMGRKRSGKDTFAERLIVAHGYKRFAFADNVRQAALDLNPIVYAQPHDEYGEVDYTRLSDVVRALGWEAAKELEEVRRTLQNFGTESIRRLDPHFWVRTVMEAVDAHEGPAVITDLRFPNEYHAVAARGGYPTRIKRPGLPETDLHISETALDDHVPALVYVNSGSIGDLHAMADGAAYVVAH